MKIEELRVGNLIYFPFHNENVKVLGLGLKSDLSKLIQVETKGTILMDKLSCFKPIPLTEEWLLNFGFEKKQMYGKHNRYFFIKNKLYYCEHDFYSFVYSNNSLEIKEPKYVHQLQSLYFALTGQELCEAK